MNKFKFFNNSFPRKILGIFIIIAPITLIGLMGFSALMIDVGIMRLTAAQLQNITDAAATAGETTVTAGTGASTAEQYLLANNHFVFNDTLQSYTINTGTWDPVNKTFTATNDANATAVQVTASITPPLFFGHLFTTGPTQMTRTATASLGPADILFLVDIGWGMSRFSSITLREITSGFSPFCYPYSLQFLEHSKIIYNLLNLPPLGTLSWTTQIVRGSAASVKTTLGLNQTPYPFPGGSWDEYIDYVKTRLLLIGCADRYDNMTFLSYLMDKRPEFINTPDLWKTPVLPLELFKYLLKSLTTNHLRENDRVGLITFYDPTNYPLVEQELTSDKNTISAVLNGDPPNNNPGRQPSHFVKTGSYFTPGPGAAILPAVSFAINKLIAEGRPNVAKIIFIASTIVPAGSDYALFQAEVQRAKDNHIYIFTMTFKELHLPLTALTFSSNNWGWGSNVTLYTGNYPSMTRITSSILTSWTVTIPSNTAKKINALRIPELVE